ncbi:MAG: ATP-binding cassette domain-containing protein, partial [Dehalococcoidia bacterium]
MIAIETNKLTKKYGQSLAVNAVSLTVNVGEVFALLGPNGAGKTTT